MGRTLAGRTSAGRTGVPRLLINRILKIFSDATEGIGEDGSRAAVEHERRQRHEATRRNRSIANSGGCCLSGILALSGELHPATRHALKAEAGTISRIFARSFRRSGLVGAPNGATSVSPSSDDAGVGVNALNRFDEKARKALRKTVILHILD